MSDNQQITNKNLPFKASSTMLGVEGGLEVHLQHILLKAWNGTTLTDLNLATEATLLLVKTIIESIQTSSTSLDSKATTTNNNLNSINTNISSLISLVDTLEALATATNSKLDLISTNTKQTGTSEVISVNSSASTQTLKAANLNRKSLTIVNDSTAPLYIKYGAGASLSDYSIVLSEKSGNNFAHAFIDDTTDLITGIWASANGSAKITEII